MPRLKVGETYKKGPHKGMRKGHGHYEGMKKHSDELREKKHEGKPKYLEKEPRKGKVISYSKHHPFHEPEKYSKEKLKEAAKHMKMHGG